MVIISSKALSKSEPAVVSCVFVTSGTVDIIPVDSFPVTQAK